MEAATTPNEEDEVLLHAELAAVDTLVAAISGKKLRKRYSFRMKREKKEEIFAFEGSEKTLSRAPGRPESVLFGMELITYVEDTRCDCLLLTARAMTAIVRDCYFVWLLLYVKDEKDASTAYESLFRLLPRFVYHHGIVQQTADIKMLFNCHNCSTTVFYATKTDYVLFMYIRKKSLPSN
ncbi:hypothetical protein F444_07749 [Phytophthora nicotianae P1976]|uniref:Uncharacterized protein n=1 Tax=Phytophthora nicotianae P1976 TaxID=1317066 RepID=A0A081ADP6_PHYNI|nr:hypothetical protein F444_07749 [Phytophthora nicotianae P1976]